MTSIFVGGAAGSALAGIIYSEGGWNGVVVAGSVFPVLALILLSKDHL